MMYTQHSDEWRSRLAGSGTDGSLTPHLLAENAFTSSEPQHCSLPTSNHSVEGLGIICPPSAQRLARDSGVDFSYDKAVWEIQMNVQGQQFQKVYQQHHHLHGQNPTNFLSTEPSQNKFHAGLLEIDGNSIQQASHGVADASSENSQIAPTCATYPRRPSRQNSEPFPNFENTAQYDSVSAYYLSTNQTSQDSSPFQPPTLFPEQGQAVLYQDGIYGIPGIPSTPFLLPGPDIQGLFERRLSMCSNAPSSMFSSEQQGTPYFMTPSSTPRFGASMTMELPSAPHSNLSSPAYQSHKRSSSSTSLKPPPPTHRNLRPAPYSLDAAQRQRRLTGKSMSLPSRRMQPPEFSLSPGHVGAVSEQNPQGLYQDSEFANGDRQSFNQSLETIRNSLQISTPKLAKKEERQVTIKTENTSPPSQRPALAVIQPKISAPLPSLSGPSVPPLDLPEQPRRPGSPPLTELSPSTGDAPTQNPVSSYDAYTPKYKRGTKGQLEGFCGLCKPGRWLNMKNSRYWYDKNYNHGINSKTRRPFDVPVSRRYKAGHNSIREGLCGVCNEWIDMDSCRMKWKHWWKHAYKCHNKLDNFDFDLEESDQEEACHMDQQRPISTLNDNPYQQHQYAEYMQYYSQPWTYQFDPLPYNSQMEFSHFRR